MFDDLTAILIVFASIFGAVALYYLRLKSQTGGRLGAQALDALERMAATAQQLERRVATLERILDGEAPSWRDSQPAFYEAASNER